MTTFAVHSKLIETQDLLDMLTLYPKRSEYDDLYLFAQPHDNPTIPEIDLQHIEDLVEFDAAYNALLTQKHEGRWVYLNAVQGRFLLKKYYTPS